MNILYLSSEYPAETGFGGIATYTRYMAESMASLGHQVHVICRALDKQVDLIQNGVKVHRVPCGPHPLPKAPVWYLLRCFLRKEINQSLNRLSWAGTAFNEFLKLSTIIKFDIIEYPDCGAEGYYFSLRNLPVVVRLHTPWTIVRQLNRLKEQPLDCFLQKYLERSAIINAKAVTSPSQALADMLSERWHIQKAAVYPNPLPSILFTSEKTGSDWIYTGRLEYRKGVHILVESYKIICKTHNPPPLLLIGRGFGTMPDGTAYEQYIRDLISQYNLNDKISIIAGVDQTEIIKFLKESSVAFFPSLWENHSYSCLEAMAASTTVCASNCGGFPEIIKDGRNGILFTCNNPLSLAEKMKVLIENKEMLKKMSIEACRSIVENFDPEEICKRALNIYKTIGDNRKK